jgi:hypothetical protein
MPIDAVKGMADLLALAPATFGKSSIEDCLIAGMLIPKVSVRPISRGDCGDPVLEDERHDVTEEGLLRLRSEEEVEGEM